MIKKFLCEAIVFYQKKISVKSLGKCKFFPAFSNYALVAIDRFGVCKGLLLFVLRLLRCGSGFCCGGVDFVPEKSHKINGH